MSWKTHRSIDVHTTVSFNTLSTIHTKTFENIGYKIARWDVS